MSVNLVVGSLRRKEEEREEGGRRSFGSPPPFSQSFRSRRRKARAPIGPRLLSFRAGSRSLGKRRRGRRCITLRRSFGRSRFGCSAWLEGGGEAKRQSLPQRLTQPSSSFGFACESKRKNRSSRWKKKKRERKRRRRRRRKVSVMHDQGPSSSFLDRRTNSLDGQQFFFY